MYWIAFFNTNTKDSLPDVNHIYDDPRFLANLLCQDIDEVKDRMAKYPDRQIILQEAHYGWDEELYRGADYGEALRCLQATEEAE